MSSQRLKSLLRTRLAALPSPTEIQNLPTAPIKSQKKRKKRPLNPQEHELQPKSVHKRKKKKKQKVGHDDREAVKKIAKPKKATELQERFRSKLDGAQFRMLNEKLYTCTGSQALKYFQEHQEGFEVYHKGFQTQVESWPENPVDIYIRYLTQHPKLKVADFGCGEAKIAQSVRNKVHSFDLVALNDCVTACDMKKVPLKSRKIDVAIFCLSLMGTNFVDYLREANRVLKKGGKLKIAEVKSRIFDTSEFIELCQNLGFDLKRMNDDNKMFVLFDFLKSERKPESLKQIGDCSHLLKPCKYKKR